MFAMPEMAGMNRPKKGGEEEDEGNFFVKIQIHDCKFYNKQNIFTY